MNTNMDLRGLAIDRRDTERPAISGRRHVLTRYVLPLTLIFGFLTLLLWAARDMIVPAQPVTVIPVFATTSHDEPAGTPLFRAAGWVEPRPTPVRVAALAAGVVEKLLVVEDQVVRAGETIAELVKDDARLTRDRALANLDLRLAELEEAQAALDAARTRFEQPVHWDAAISEAQSLLARLNTEIKNLPFEIRRAEADLEAARQVHENKVAARGVVAGVEIDIAKSKVDAARALVEELHGRRASLMNEQEALRQRCHALRTQRKLLVDETQAKEAAMAKTQAAQARVAQARAALEEAELQLQRMTVVSPMDGRVFRLVAHQGARIGGSAQHSEHDSSTVVTLYNPDMLQVRVDVRFDDIPKVSMSQPVEIHNPTIAKPIKGAVLFISSEADIQKNTLQVKVAIPDPPSVFKPSMLVDVTFFSPPTRAEEDPAQGPVAAQQGQSRFYVPEQLILNEDGAQYVWLVDPSAQVARKTKVQTGNARREGLVEVADGLTITSRLIASGHDQLTDGCRIRISGESQVFEDSTPGPAQGAAATDVGQPPRHDPGL